MKIALMIPELTGGGAQRAAQILGNHLEEVGHEVYYFMVVPSAPVAYKVKGKIKNIDISIFRENFYGSDAIKFWNSIKSAGRIIKLQKKKIGIDVSISFMEECNFLNVYSSIGEKVIVSVRTTLSERDEFNGYLYKKECVKRVYNRAYRIVAVSDYVRNDLIVNYGVNLGKLITISNVSMKHDLDCSGGEWIFGKKVIISVARINPEKQLDHIIRAFKYVHEQCKEAKLLILGTGPLEDYMKWYAKQLDLVGSVHFLGFVEDVGYYMRNSKVFVMASKAEGFPNSMVEAMSYGVPVVTTNSPGGCREIVANDILINVSIREVKYEKYGIMVPYVRGKDRLDTCYDEDVYMAEGILKILNDDKLYEQYSKRSLERARDYSYDVIMSKWDRIIRG